MEAIVAILSYLLGSIPTGYIVGKLAGLDIRESGSGNIGATNVARVAGKGRGLLTLLADSAKGFVPAVVAQQLSFSHTAVAAIAAAAFLGHLYPVFLRFQGGKGVATAFGVLLALAPLATLVALVVFTALILVSRTVSLSSIGAAIAAPIAIWFFSYPLAWIVMSALFAAMIILRHRANIQRLLAGTEPKFGTTSSR
ncbi:MAG TPA: glycerol-3-phosphate 1-O-acyltransferase PlsY [Candidatus Binatia bacterium]|jgi:glycerol-3-phosphate acyltransferase PlsY